MIRLTLAIDIDNNHKAFGSTQEPDNQMPTFMGIKETKNLFTKFPIIILYFRLFTRNNPHQRFYDINKIFYTILPSKQELPSSKEFKIEGFSLLKAASVGAKIVN